MGINQKTANTWKAKKRRKARLDAINQEKFIGLSTDRLQSRMKLVTRQLEARDVITQLYDNEAIYCCKTGAIIGTINATAMALQHEVGLSADGLAIYQNNSNVHPAWLNTSSEQLKQLQIMMPHEYIVYTVHELQDKNAGALQRHNELVEVYKQPLESVVKLGELLRVALGLFGKCLLDLPPSPFTANDIDSYIEKLYLWCKGLILRLQKQYHANEINKHNIVTLADILNFSTDLGQARFRQARLGDSDDDTTLIDVAEIFANDNQLEVAIRHQKPLKVKPKQYSGKIFVQSTDGNVTNEDNNADFDKALDNAVTVEKQKANNNGNSNSVQSSLPPIKLFSH